jgi:isopentenyl diphosphate isomerase/L-lactate dehydrogenase-like FMN-dependent dehydrogenase
LNITGDHVTKALIEQSFREVLLITNILVDVSHVDISTTILGHKVSNVTFDVLIPRLPLPS